MIGIVALAVIPLGCTYTAFPCSTVANTDELGDVVPRLSHSKCDAVSESYACCRRRRRAVSVGVAK